MWFRCRLEIPPTANLSDWLFQWLLMQENQIIALISCLSKAFETILNRKFLKHLSSFSLLSDQQYGFRKGSSTGDLLAFLIGSWSSSLSRFGETFAVAIYFRKLWIESGTKRCSLSYPLTVSLLPSVLSFLPCFLLSLFSSCHIHSFLSFFLPSFLPSFPVI